MTEPDHTPVQAIAVVPGSHQETITAVALASAMAVLQSDTNQEPWTTWLAGSFTKTVRTIKRPAQQEKIQQDPAVVSSITIGGATAYAYAPMSYEAFPSHLRRLRVSGLDVRSTSAPLPRPRNAQIPVLATPVVIIETNSEVEMTTGKLSAQVAHALVAWVRRAPQRNLEAWTTDPRVALVTTNFSDRNLDRPESITIRDNGLTEIDPHTPTVHIARV